MVSQPEPSSLVSRGPSSVVSRPSLSRTKRYNRSHAGGTSSSRAACVVQNEFPVFSASGDVDIIIRVAHFENRYLLHRHTLTRCSGFFEASTSPEWSRAGTRPSATYALAGGNEVARLGEDGNPLAVEAEGDAPASGTVANALRKRWRYELDQGLADGVTPMLIQKEESTSPHTSSSSRSPHHHHPPPTSSSIFGGGGTSSILSHGRRDSHSRSNSLSNGNNNFFRSVANLSLAPRNPDRHDPSSTANLSLEEQDLVRDYDNLFRIFYNYPPVLDGINVADAYVQCKSLLALADLYDALAVVGPRVDHHLLQFQSRLWKQIAKYPISYLRLGYLARSKVIFQEALIHVVGQWPAGERNLRAALPDVVIDIIEDKVDELEETVARIEARLFRLNLTTSRGDRVHPSTSYVDWLAVSLFRQWLADHTAPPPPPSPPSSSSQQRRVRIAAHDDPPGLGWAYRTLGGANPGSFLGHDECKKFLKLTPELYGRDNLRRFEKRIDELKTMARDVVRPLMSSCLELDLGGSRAGDAITYLTCTAVGNRDLPWPVDD